MSEIETHLLGPALAGTLVCSEFDAVVQAYQKYLSMSLQQEGVVPESLIEAWGCSQARYGKARMAVLMSESGVPWLRVIEDVSVESPQPLREYGWLSLEVLVADVDALAAELEGSPFTILGGPACLAMSDKIRACQVVGPAGEVLYLTQIDGEVPPFQVPQAVCDVDRLFIPVLSVPDRDAAAAWYAELAGVKPIITDTKITCINRAFELDMESEHPIAVLQLADKSMIEIDGLAMASPRACINGGLPAGITMVSFYVDDITRINTSAQGPWVHIDDDFYNGKESALFKGCSGELVELIER